MKIEHKIKTFTWWWYLLIIITISALTSMIVYSFHKSIRMNTVYAPLIDAAMEIKLKATMAHLWFEENLSGDRHEEMDVVWKFLDQADWYSQAMLEGGKNPEGTFIPLDDAEMRQNIFNVQAKLSEFRDITKQRLAARKISGPGTDIDQQYDKVFMIFINQADEVEARLKQIMAQDLRKFQFTQTTLIIICLLLSVFVGTVFYRFERQRTKNLIALHNTNENLEIEISKRKCAENERKKLINELQNNNAELERYTYTVSHDLKSPLITIKGFLGILERDTVDGNTERIKENVSRIHNVADKMNQLLDELLELSRVGRVVGTKEEVSLKDLASEAANLVEGQIKELGVQVEIAPDLPVIYVDRCRLVEVLQNLIDNAVKHMGKQPEPRIEIGTRQENGEDVYYVRDNGIGIEPRYHENVFGLFNKLEHKSEGTGIGLAIVRRIVEVHGGRIWVESEGNERGSTFCFTIAKKGEIPDHDK